MKKKESRLQKLNLSKVTISKLDSNKQRKILGGSHNCSGGDGGDGGLSDGGHEGQNPTI